MPRMRTSCSASRIRTSRTSDASASSSLRSPSACSGFRCWPGFHSAGMPLSPTRSSSRARRRAGSPKSSSARGLVDESALAQRHEQRREQHVVVRLQLRERRHQLDAAQRVLVRREVAHRLERGAHPRCQRTDVDFGGLQVGVLGGRTGVRRPEEKRYHTTTDFLAQCRVVICRESTAADGAGRSQRARRGPPARRFASSASTRVRRRPASASSTGRTATPATWRAGPSARAARRFRPGCARSSTACRNSSGSTSRRKSRSSACSCTAMPTAPSSWGRRGARPSVASFREWRPCTNTRRVK